MPRTTKIPKKKPKTKRGSKSAAKTIIRLPSLDWHLMPEEFKEVYRAMENGQLLPGQKGRWIQEYRHKEIMPFIESGFESFVLRDLLKHNPRLFMHPIVWYLLLHLCFPPSYRTKAYDELAEVAIKTILEGFVKGLLPNFDIEWVRKKEKRGRGRPPLGEKQVTDSDLDVLRAYQAVLKIIKEELPSHLVRRSDRDRTMKKDFAVGIRRIWKRWNPELWETRILLDGHIGFKLVEHQLPDEKVTEWVTDIIGIRDKKLQFRDQLAYRMVNFHLGVSERQNWTYHAIKKRVEKVRKYRPSLAKSLSS